MFNGCQKSQVCTYWPWSHDKSSGNRRYPSHPTQHKVFEKKNANALTSSLILELSRQTVSRSIPQSVILGAKFHDRYRTNISQRLNNRWQLIKANDLEIVGSGDGPLKYVKDRKKKCMWWTNFSTAYYTELIRERGWGWGWGLESCILKGGGGGLICKKFDISFRKLSLTASPHVFVHIFC